MDFQLLTFFILAILTFAVVALIVYLILVLKELRTTISRANEILQNVHNVTSTFSNPLAAITGLISGVLKTVKEIRKEF